MKPTKPIFWAPAKKPARKATAKRRDLEGPIQKQIIKIIETLRPGIFVFHIPNGGKRSALAGKRLKDQGVKPGVADLCLILENGKVCFIEVKAPNGRKSPEQEAFIEICMNRRVPVCVLYGTEQVEQLLTEWSK